MVLQITSPYIPLCIVLKVMISAVGDSPNSNNLTVPHPINSQRRQRLHPRPQCFLLTDPPPQRLRPVKPECLPRPRLRVPVIREPGLLPGTFILERQCLVVQVFQLRTESFMTTFSGTQKYPFRIFTYFLNLVEHYRSFLVSFIFAQLRENQTDTLTELKDRKLF